MESPTVLVVGMKTCGFLELTRRLRNAGYEFVHELNGKRAITWLGSRSFDAVMVPTKPDSMDKIEFVLKAERLADCPILVAKEGIPKGTLESLAGGSKSIAEAHPRTLLVTALIAKVPPGPA